MPAWNFGPILESLGNNFVKFLPTLAALFIVGIFNYVFFSVLLFENYRTYRWIPVQGTLLKRGKSRGTKGYTTDLAYLYKFRGIEHRGVSFTSWEQYSHPGAVEARLNRLPQIGQSVTVYVNPKRPEKSVLRQGWSDLTELILGLIFCGFLLIFDLVILYGFALPVLKR
jgi:hypothetical protein